MPEQLQGRLAAIAQDRLRLHVLMCAGVPEGVTRPLVFDTMQTMWINNPNNIQVKPRMQCGPRYTDIVNVSMWCAELKERRWKSVFTRAL